MEYLYLKDLSMDGRLYINERTGIVEALIPMEQNQTAHAPTLVELSEGELLCGWFAGSYEGNTDVCIICSRLERKNSVWAKPVQISTDMNRSEQNPSFFQAEPEELWVVYTAQLGRITGKNNMQYTAEIRYQKSRDDGHSWEPEQKLIDETGVFCRQPIQKLSDGKWVLGTWRCRDTETELGDDDTVIRISEDKGRSWRTVDMPGSIGRVHANVIELKDGKLKAFLRSRQADYIYQSMSEDRGENWTVPVPTELPNNNSGISVIKLKSGRLAIAYNPTQAPENDGVCAVWPGLRCPVAVALSEDDGETWPYIRILEYGEGFFGRKNKNCNKSYEYPYLMQDRDEVLHLVYAYGDRRCIKYMRFTESDILGEVRKEQVNFNPTAGK